MTTSTDVPGLLPCAIDGHAYLCDPTYERSTVQVIRQQADTSSEAGEQSLNPQGLWRRSQESWHHGAGQDFLDGRLGDTPPDPHRFRASKGMDIWTKGQISLLDSTLKVWSSSASNLFLAVDYIGTSGPFVLHVADGNEVYFNTVPYNQLNSYALQNGTGWVLVNATLGAFTNGFKLTATAASAFSAQSPIGTAGMIVSPGRRYAVLLQSLYISGGAARTPSVSVTWYTAAGAAISTTTPVAAPGTDSSLVNAVDTPTAPALAATAAVTISYPTASAGEIHEVRQAILSPYDDVFINVTYGDIWHSHDINAGDPAQPVQSLASNGSTIWAALGTSGLHRTAGISNFSTPDVPAAPASGQISMVAYCAPFLLAAGSAGVTATLQNTLWRVDTPLGASTLTAIKTHDNASFVWVGAASGRNCVYAWGNAGGTGEIYKILFDPNTGTLATAASPATSWIDGETIHSLVFYAGSAILGTGKGVRIGTIDGAGNIDYGPLIRTEWPVRCLEPQDRYCWFGWAKYDGTQSGLGRIDLGFLTDQLTPAYASDLMTPDTTQGDTVSAVTFSPYGYAFGQRPPVRIFSVAGKGVYVEDPGGRPLEGTLETGTIRYSMSEPKHARTTDVMYHVSAASSGALSLDSKINDAAAWTDLGAGTAIATGGTAFTTDDEGESFELRVRLSRAVDSSTVGQQTSLEVTRWTLKSLPLPSSIDETFVLTLHMKERILTSNGTKRYQDVPAEVTFLKGLERSRDIIEFQLGSETFEGYVAQSQWKGTDWNNPKREFAEGHLQVQLMTVRG